MTRPIPWPLLVCGVTSLCTTGCLEEDPNMDGVLSMTGTSSASGETGSMPGTADDDTAGTADETETPPTGDPPMQTTIYDIQMGLVPEGTTVTLENVVVVSPVQATDGGVVVQDPGGGPYSAIYLYLWDDVVMGVPLTPGDEITFTGEYTEFYDFSEITVSAPGDIQITGTAAVPDPVDVSPAEIVAGADTAEQYESVPVCMADVTATDSTNQYGDFHVDDDVAVSNFFLFDTDDFLQVLPGTAFGSLCGPLLYNFEEYKVAPRGASDYTADLVGCGDAATPATIYDIQQGMFAPDDLVRVEDVVVTTPFNTDGDLFWVQDPAGGARSGIAVYMPMPGGFVPSPGDVVTLCGAYDEYYEQSQLQISAAADVSSGGSGPVPPPEVLMPDQVGSGAAAEDWEGVLVQVGPTVVTMQANMYGEWIVDDVLMVTPEFIAQGTWPLPLVDDMFTSLTGVMVYSFDNYKLAPRDLGDIVP